MHWSSVWNTKNATTTTDIRRLTPIPVFMEIEIDSGRRSKNEIPISAPAAKANTMLMLTALLRRVNMPPIMVEKKVIATNRKPYDSGNTDPIRTRRKDQPCFNV